MYRNSGALSGKKSQRQPRLAAGAINTDIMTVVRYAASRTRISSEIFLLSSPENVRAVEGEN